MNLTVGQIVYIRNLENYYRNNPDTPTLSEATITKIGRKFLETSRGKFDVNTLIHINGKYSPTLKLYLSPDDFHKENEHRTKFKNIHSFFESYNYSKIDIETLREIYTLIIK